MKRIPALAAFAALAVALYIGWSKTREAPRAEAGEAEIVAPVAIGIADKKAAGECHGGCSLAKHDIPDFTEAEFAQAIDQYSQALPDEDGEALDKLLFYSSKTDVYLKRLGSGPLSPLHVEFLQRELRKTHATVRLRLVDENDKVRVATGPMRVPLGHKQHLHAEVNDDQSLEFNGTVLRTGLYHLWSRY